MRVVRDHRVIPDAARGCALAIGNFDGIHLGHQAVLNTMIQHADTHGLPKAVMTFEPHPRCFFHPETERFRIMAFHHKVRHFAQMGIDTVFAFRFNAALSNVTADDFMHEVLGTALNVQHVVTGQDFIFGKARGGNAMLLAEYAKQSGAFTCDAIAPQGAEGMTYSSSRARQLIETAEMQQVADILGRPYQWLGRVFRGDQRGRTIGFPTANILPPPVLMPARGVYAVRAGLMGEKAAMDGVANLGVRPTVGGKRLQLEVHLLDRDIQLYDRRLWVNFLHYIRPEQRFDGVDALKAQITHDAEEARTWLAKNA